MVAATYRPRFSLSFLGHGDFRFRMASQMTNGVIFNFLGKWKADNLCYDAVLRTRQCNFLSPSETHSHHCHHHHHRQYLSQIWWTCLRKVGQRRDPSSRSPSNRPLLLLCSRYHTSRPYSVLQEDNPNQTSSTTDLYKLVSEEMSSIAPNIRKALTTDQLQLRTMAHYYFDGKGKTFRPLVALLMSKACNIHNSIGDSILESQRIVAMVTEMIHTASLVHDDVIDASDTRRGQSSLNKLYGQRQSILVGDFILSHASIALARTRNTEVISVLSSVIEDLVSGEFMQLGSKENENERFSHYLMKTYKKTASLIANTCKSVAILSESSEEILELAFQYGRNLGIAFQLIDDLLDFVSNESALGKPTAADLKLGLATAPVLFAAQEYPELHPMVMRRFSQEGDVELARSLVAKSDGVKQTRLLAEQHSKEAIKNLQQFAASKAQLALVRLATVLLERKK